MGISLLIFKPREMSTGTSVPNYIVKIVHTVKNKPHDSVRLPQTEFGLRDDTAYWERVRLASWLFTCVFPVSDRILIQVKQRLSFT